MDLHSGLPYWIVKNELFNYFNPLKSELHTDVLIIGSGITGALVAHELCSAGVKCTIIDKRTPATGSTAASTAQLQYEIDVPLCDMTKMVGEQNAVQAYRESLQAITDIEKICKELPVDASFSRCSSLFLASDKKGLKLLEREYEARVKAELPVTFLDKDTLKQQHLIDAPGALKNNEAAQMDAYSMATGIIRHHMKHSELKLFTNTTVDEYKEADNGYVLKTSEGHLVHCKYVIVAAGFEAGKFLPRKVMDLNSTYALVSEPVEPDMLWPERCLIWETAQPYFYLRTTADNRMVIGGEDEDFKDPERRDKLLRNKIRKLEKKFAALYPDIPFKTDMAWCGTFSSTKDGLPYIGAWPGREKMLFALGYGGNGITFSMIAAQVIRNKISGVADNREQLFGFKRSNHH